MLFRSVNLDIALACRDYLKSAGITTVISRTTDVYKSVQEKSSQCNSENPACCVEIHNNAGNGRAVGFEVYYQSKNNNSKNLATAIEECVKEIGQTSRGVKTNLLSSGADYYHMLREVKCPSVLVECAFLDSEDYLKVNTHAKRQIMGIALAKGVLKFLGKSIPKDTNQKKIMYIVQAGAFSTKEAAEVYAKQLTKYGIKSIIKKMEV